MFRAALFAATMFGLHGCMSSATEQLESIQTTSRPVNAAVAADQSAVSAEKPASEIAAQAAADARMLNAANVPLDQAAVVDPAVAPSKNINAAQNSIFANAGNVSAPSQKMALNELNAASTNAGVNAAQSSIYSGAIVPATPAERMAVPVPAADAAAQAQELALAGLSETPVASDAAATLPTYEAATEAAPKANDQQEKKIRTLADFFRAKSTEKKFETARYEKTARTTRTDSIPNMRTAALPDSDLPGVSVNALLPTNNLSDDEMPEDDDQPAGLMKLASLSGMTRVAPNGLWTQTDQVEVRCLRPQLVNMLKYVENHYRRHVIVTSGYRDPMHNRRAGGVRHSLHTLCAAADIQIDGVSKWELADFLRSIPGRGGVGTYCHTNSVHIDVGGERDWNWRCRRKKRRI
jgi:uncharacterized protein YcbK (DUF882 family)